MKFVPLALALTACTSCATAHVDWETRLLSRLADSSVEIEMNGSRGSGTVVWSDGKRTRVLTALHVVADGGNFSVTYRGKSCAATTEDIDAANDLALAYVFCNLGAKPIKVAKVEPQAYEHVWLMGNLWGNPRTPGMGVISNTTSKILGRALPLYHVVATMYHGDSGGTLVNANGELVGVPSCVDTAPVQVVGDTDDGMIHLPLYSFETVQGAGYYVGLPAIRKFLKPHAL